MKFLESLRSKIWIAKVLSLLAGLVYFIQSIFFAHHLDVTMDEGTYLVKGFLYVTGVYRPFQPYGPWTNKMPLAFTIPGLAQAIFEPGLRTGRYFAVFLSMLMLFGLWLVANRLRGQWWAAALMWVMALNSGNITYYSRALSQGIVACMLVWVLVLVLGKNRRLWQTTLGAVLATLIVIVRQNMIPMPFLVIVFIFWAYGRRAGFYALAAAAVVFIGYHLQYWPAILEIWTSFLPSFARKMIYQILSNSGWTGTGGSSVWNPSFDFLSKTFAFMEGVRLNFFASIGLLCTLIFWPRLKNWKSSMDFKMSVFLTALVIVLGAAHFYASFYLDYCLYCYSGYLSFFMPAALLLIAISAPSWKKQLGWISQTLGILVVLISSVGIGYGGYQVLDDFVLNIPVPRMQNMRFLPGTVEIWTFLFNKFGWSYEILQKALPAVAGLILGVVFILICSVAYRSSSRKDKPISLGFVVLVAFFLVGAVLSPTKMLGGGKYADVCQSDVIASHEAVGNQLAELVPEGSLVYWQNDVSPLPLLYLPGRKFFPPQLNHWYTYREGGDPDILNKNGFWNAELANRWIEEADYLLIADQYVPSFAKKQGFSEMVDELSPTGLTVACRENSIIHIFRRKK